MLWLQLNSAGNLINDITHGQYDVEINDPWPKISIRAKDLVKKLLEINPDKRLTPDEALHHPWLSVLLNL